SILLYSPGTEVLSITIWELWENGQYVKLSAQEVLFILALFVLVMVSQFQGKIFGVKEWSGESRAESRRALHRIPQRARPDRARRARRDVRGAGGEAVHAARSERLRKDHDPALDRGSGAAARGRDQRRRPGRLFLDAERLRRAQPARLRHGVPVLRHLAAHERLPERGLSAGGRRPQVFRAGNPGQGPARPQSGAARRARRSRGDQ